MNCVKALLPDDEEGERHASILKIFNEIRNLYKSGKCGAPARGTLWGALHGVGEETDNALESDTSWNPAGRGEQEINGSLELPMEREVLVDGHVGVSRGAILTRVAGVRDNTSHAFVVGTQPS